MYRLKNNPFYNLSIPGANVGSCPVEGHAFSVPVLGMKMLWVAPGTFMMGSPKTEAGRMPDEDRHEVVLTRGYWLGRHAVTSDNWGRVMFARACGGLGFFEPVDSATWLYALEFCELLNARERAAGRLPAGYVYTLPTEAQWEYACRAGTTGPYAGNLGLMAWYVKNTKQEQVISNRYGPSRTVNSFDPSHVGLKKPNAWGFHDMHGNMWEWCLDLHGEYPQGRVVDPLGPLEGSAFVRRGGCSVSKEGECRSASRGGFGKGMGFRLCLAPACHRPEAQPHPGRDFRGGGMVGRMIWVGPGTFPMGSPDGERGRHANERRHTVVLSRGYWLAERSITRAAWDMLMPDNVQVVDVESMRRPVDSVAWADCVEFCRRLTLQERARGCLPEGYAYTLPTEAQWEYACRAGTTGPFPGVLDEMGWYLGNSGGAPSYVGLKTPNPWGFHDMHGNVWEWCLDGMGDYPDGVVTDPLVDPDGNVHVARGGCFLSPDYECRSAQRFGLPPTGANFNMGMRLCLVSVSG